MLTIDVLRDEAQEVRDILRPRLSQGIRVQERRSWWFWVRFTVTGPDHILRSVDHAVAEWRGGKIMENAL